MNESDVQAKLNAARRLLLDCYVPWTNAGGPNECKHGRAEGIPCPRCDEALVGLDEAEPDSCISDGDPQEYGDN